jgi:anti-anti-sigma regulatory factor
MVESGVREVSCDVRALVDPHPAALDVVLRLALVARRSGGRIRLTGVSPAMRAVIVFFGLAETLGVDGNDHPA